MATTTPVRLGYLRPEYRTEEYNNLYNATKNLRKSTKKTLDYLYRSGTIELVDAMTPNNTEGGQKADMVSTLINAFTADKLEELSLLAKKVNKKMKDIEASQKSKFKKVDDSIDGVDIIKSEITECLGDLVDRAIGSTLFDTITSLNTYRLISKKEDEVKKIKKATKTILKELNPNYEDPPEICDCCTIV